MGKEKNREEKGKGMNGRRMERREDNLIFKIGKDCLDAMMGVSYREERMIGNVPFSLFNWQKGK